MGVKKIKPVIDIYIKELKKKITLEKVILFGSCAKGKIEPDSDIDLAVISSDFAGLSADAVFDLLAHARLHTKTRNVAMDIFGFTPEEFSSASPLTTLGEVKETGVTVFSK